MFFLYVLDYFTFVVLVQFFAIFMLSIFMISVSPILFPGLFHFDCLCSNVYHFLSYLSSRERF